MQFAKMDPAVKTRWLEALRSRKYPQCTHKLFDAGVGYCCLGVLCEIEGKLVSVPDTGELLRGVMTTYPGNSGDQFEYCLPPDELQKLWGMYSELPAGQNPISILTRMNDGPTDASPAIPGIEPRKHSFEEIAQWIAERL